jgi:hypothetical protein
VTRARCCHHGDDGVDVAREVRRAPEGRGRIGTAAPVQNLRNVPPVMHETHNKWVKCARPHAVLIMGVHNYTPQFWPRGARLHTVAYINSFWRIIMKKKLFGALALLAASVAVFAPSAASANNPAGGVDCSQAKVKCTDEQANCTRRPDPIGIACYASCMVRLGCQP